MRKLLLSLSLVLFVSMAFSQQPAKVKHLTESFIEEKVKDEKLADLLMRLGENPQDEEIMAKINQHLQKRPESGAAFQEMFKENRGESSFSGGAEPFIAMNPANTNQLAISYMASGQSFEYPVYYSIDGGDTWTQSNFSTTTTLDNYFPGDDVLGGGDPVLAFDDNGTLHMTWIYLHGTGFNITAGMFYAYSNDGGMTFNIPTDTADHVIHDESFFPNQDMLDRQWMHVDNTGGTHDGNLYMSAIYFGGTLGNAGEVVLVKDADSTGFYTSPTVALPISGSEGAQFGNIKVDNNGNVHLSCMKFDSNSGAGGVYYTKSTDGAQTFAAPVQLASATTSLPNGGTHIVHDRDNSATSMAVDGDNIYIAWTDMANNDVRGFYTYSNDGGINFSAPIEFGANLLDTSYYHLMPNVAADNGKVSISWYAVRKSDFITDYYMAESIDGGATFTEVGVVSTGQTDFANEGSGFYGDYNTSVKDDCFTYSIWGDGRTGAPVVYIAKVDACTELGLTEIIPVTDKFRIEQLYPNPAQSELNLDVYIEEADQIQIQVLDASGRVVKELYNGGVNAGNTTLNLNVSSIAGGNYLLNVTSDQGFRIAKAFIKE